jgi:hypothetical protein
MFNLDAISYENQELLTVYASPSKEWRITLCVRPFSVIYTSNIPKNPLYPARQNLLLISQYYLQFLAKSASLARLAMPHVNWVRVFS